MRVAWRVAEGEELLDADGIDDNVVQVGSAVAHIAVTNKRSSRST